MYTITITTPTVIFNTEFALRDHGMTDNATLVLDGILSIFSVINDESMLEEAVREDKSSYWKNINEVFGRGSSPQGVKRNSTV